ncbi:dipeptide/oligopeptide/nickel ABC transporter permease/ATP-binding protein [Chelatococcus reniformis]|uniref:Peptide ABC transporter permease n=1 Tax=Chelatococcus reniformis TaxID=1494448 RepID=A0A916X8V6_9HYPH|nr:dipeptide/oligopeptide/nickel ABC transporter permease/ATP-binding protein [Chelatococcus reniformis]GGC52859.1 peptide ABC transporter permease [Chelatococcus reniformis]
MAFVASKGPSRRLHGVRRVWAGLSAGDRIVVLLFALIVSVAIAGPWLAPHPTMTADPAQRLLPPSLEHWLGTDDNGIDVFSRLLAAPRTDVTIALVATLLSVLVGAPLGVLAGLFESHPRRVLSLTGEGMLRLLDVLQAFPVFILAMVLVAIRGPGTENVILAVAFVNFPVFLRLVRSELLSLRQRPFAEAARAIGRSDLAAAFVHLLPNALPTVVVQLSVTVGFAVLLTAGLSFVGAGIRPPTPELGAMIAGGAKFMALGQWWVSLFPGLALGAIVFVCGLFGEVIGRALEPGASSAPRRRRAPPLAAAAAATNAPAADPQALLAVDRLSLIGDDPEAPLLETMSLSLRPGERLGIVGVAGAGKSLLLRTVLALPPPGTTVRGRVRFEGRDLETLPAAELRRLRGATLAAILPNAKAQLNPLVRIGDFMAAQIRAHVRCSEAEARRRAAKMLVAVGLTDPERRLDAYPHELSGGMAQRVCIAIALLHRPRLLVADEPTAGLDVTVQRQVLDLMLKLSKEQNVAQIVATRDLGIVAHYCDTVAVLEGGRLVEMGPVAAVLTAPSSAVTHRLIAASRGETA